MALPLLLLHAPPEVPSLKVVVPPPSHTAAVPVMPAGTAFTVMAVVAMQLVPSENVIVALPRLTPPTVPLVPIVATAVLLLLQVPPPTSLSVVVAPIHALVVPVIADGADTIVTVEVEVHPLEST